MGKKNTAKVSPASVNSKKTPKNGIKKNAVNTKFDTKKTLGASGEILSKENKNSLVDNISEKIKDAVKSHKEHASKTAKNSLFPDIDNALSLTFTLKKLAPDHPSSTKYIDLPFPERSPENTSVCLILPDIAKTKEVNTNTDTEIESREWSEILEEKFGIDKSLYSKIFTLRQLRREVRGFEAIQSFSRSYDVFMAASNVFKSTISHLGKNFLKVNKSLFPLCLKSHPKQKIENVVKRVAIRITPSKLNMLTKIGNTSQKVEELVKNGEVVVKTFLEGVPGGLENIRCIYLGNVGGVVSLPVYVSAGNPSGVDIPKPKTMVNTEEEVIDEVTTIAKDNIVVGVTKSGKINFRDASTKELLRKKRKNVQSDENDIVPTKTAKKSGEVSKTQAENGKKNNGPTNDVPVKSGKINTIEVPGKEKKIPLAKKAPKTVNNGNSSTKNPDKIVSIENVGSQDKPEVAGKKKKLNVDAQKNVKVKNIIEKKNLQTNISNAKTPNGKRELTPPTLRSSVTQKKKTTVMKVEESKQKVNAPLKQVSEAPKVYVAEGSSGKLPTVKKVVKTIVKKKVNGSAKKNK
uniref:Ribosomal L1 domain-containing protein 1 n=1 Tax=Strongyloides venezuelensis TaxID=75913 RepID=A0A0K0FKE6_STRVS